MHWNTLKEMKRWLTSLFFLIALISSVPAGTPFSGGSMNNNVCPMKCCKKRSAQSTKPKSNDVAICRTLNCSTPSPFNSNSSSQTNFAPNLVLFETLSIFEKLFETKSDQKVQPLFKENAKLNKSQPKYIQHQSFLI
jgi:hypothetical protein